MENHPWPTLESRCGGRQNNLTLLRLLAALSVLVSHAFFLVRGDEPLFARLHETPGSIAVDVFFVVSGFLVTRSLFAREDAVAFCCARVLRIFPGLVVEAIFVAVALGAFQSPLPASEYFASFLPLNYVFTTATLRIGTGALPGVALPNASLWSLPLEVALYCMLLVSWLAARAVATRDRGQGTAWATAIACAALFALAAFWFTRSGGIKLAAMFGAGIACHFLRRRIRLSWLLAGLAFGVILISAVNGTAFRVALVCLLPYLVMCAAYLPRGRILKFNALGDYSYGVYIYAFPIQLVAVHRLAHAGVWTIIALTSVASLAMAILSWKFVEEQALRNAPAVTDALRRVLGRKVAPSSSPGS